MRSETLHSSEREELYRRLPPIYRLILDLGCSTGLRISDIIKLERRILDIKEPTIKETKTGKSKRIYIPKSTRIALKAHIATCTPSKYIFASNKSKSGHITRQTVYKAFSKAAKAADIKSHISPHSMRKYYARKALSRRKDLHYVQNKLNHSHLADTLLYLIDSGENI